jgi:hypothetical protein
MSDNVDELIKEIAVKHGIAVRRQISWPVGDNYLDRLTDM